MAGDNYEGSPTKMLKVNLESRFWHDTGFLYLVIPVASQGEKRRMSLPICGLRSPKLALPRPQLDMEALESFFPSVSVWILFQEE